MAAKGNSMFHSGVPRQQQEVEPMQRRQKTECFGQMQHIFALFID